MPPRLVPLTRHGGPLVPLTRPVLLVGRHPDADIRIDSPSISRRHCCLAVAYERIVIRDLGSRHGIWVNGRQVQQAQLFPGDEVAIAQLLYKVEDSDTPPASKPEVLDVARPISSLEAGVDDSEVVVKELGINTGGEFSLRD